MAFFGLYGAHASGKTTAVHTLWDNIVSGAIEFQPGTRLTIVFADNSADRYCWDDGETYIIPGLKKQGRSPWKGTMEQKTAMIDAAVADDGQVWLVESARFDTHRVIADMYKEYDGGARVVLVTTAGDVMRQFLIERCADRGKKFNYKYWEPNRLVYEGFGRYINQARKSLSAAGVPWASYQIDAEREVWAEVLGHIVEWVDKPIEGWYE